MINSLAHPATVPGAARNHLAANATLCHSPQGQHCYYQKTKYEFEPSHLAKLRKEFKRDNKGKS